MILKLLLNCAGSTQINFAFFFSFCKCLMMFKYNKCYFWECTISKNSNLQRVRIIFVSINIKLKQIHLCVIKKKIITRDGFGLNKVTKVKISSYEKSVYYYVDNVAKLQLLKT